MNEARFMELLSAFGAEFSRWPDGERDAAEAFLEAAPHRLRDIWESERAFDRILAQEAALAGTLFLEARVLARAPAGRPRAMQSLRRAVALQGQWLAGGALAASLAIGFVAGYLPATEPTQAEIGNMVDLYGGDAGEVFLTAMTEPGE